MDSSVQKLYINLKPQLPDIEINLFSKGLSLFKENKKDALIEFSRIYKEQQEQENYQNALQAQIYIIKIQVWFTNYLNVKKLLETYQESISKLKDKIANEKFRELEYFRVHMLYKSGYYFKVLETLKEMVAWNHLKFNRVLDVKSKIQLARVYFELGNHYESKKLFQAIKTQIKTEGQLQNNQNLWLSFYIVKSKYLLSLRLFKKFAKYVLRMYDCLDQDKQVQKKQLQKFFSLSNLITYIEPKLKKEKEAQKVGKTDLQEIYNSSKLLIFSSKQSQNFVTMVRMQ
ncbi:UNKNOWN [Stylonychia lemnae]|uniref:Uncharacterized protein n=1 Tax=Stylonychia lemnae TaxID=5949 RepID=A0A078B228_STYLE|nr:UNKNOWN [Stylonychia lemnae]|eukprot:CDW88554.1 UNKNOWN [Stylonychia lemnae]